MPNFVRPITNIKDFEDRLDDLGIRAKIKNKVFKEFRKKETDIEHELKKISHYRRMKSDERKDLAKELIKRREPYNRKKFLKEENKSLKSTELEAINYAKYDMKGLLGKLRDLKYARTRADFLKNIGLNKDMRRKLMKALYEPVVDERLKDKYVDEIAQFLGIGPKQTKASALETPTSRSLSIANRKPGDISIIKTVNDKAGFSQHNARFNAAASTMGDDAAALTGGSPENYSIFAGKQKLRQSTDSPPGQLQPGGPHDYSIPKLGHDRYPSASFAPIRKAV